MFKHEKYRLINVWFSLIFLLFIGQAVGQSNQFQTATRNNEVLLKDSLDYALQMAKTHLYENNDSSFYFAKIAVRVSHKTNKTPESAKANEILGDVLDELAEYPEGLNAYAAAKELYGELNEPVKVALVTGKIANLHLWQSQFEEALANYQLALKMLDSLGEKHQAISIYNNMGILYEVQGNTEDALTNYIISLELDEKRGNSKGLAASYRNVGQLYGKLDRFEDAVAYVQKAVVLDTESNNLKGMGLSKVFLGEVYLNTGEIEKSRIELTEGIKILEGIQDKTSLMHAYNTFAQVCNMEKNHNEALRVLRMAIKFSEELGADMENLTSHQNMAETFAFINNLDSAYAYQLKFNELKDTLINQERVRQIAEMKEQFESEKREKQIQIQQLEIESQNLEINKNKILKIGLFSGMALLVFILFLIINRYRLKQQANQLLKSKNDELHEKNDIINEKNKNITESITYARSLQNAILPSEESLAKSLGDYFVFWQPRDIVSGDFYWFHSSGDKAIIIAADCTGHGVPGAFVSISCNNVLNDVIIRQGKTDPGEILTLANIGVHDVFKKQDSIRQADDGMDASIMVWDKAKNVLKYAGAMNPLIMVRDKCLTEIKASRRSIGGSTSDDFEFASTEIELKSGDLFYLLSDGFQDQFGGPKGKKFLVRNFHKLLLHISEMGMEEQKLKLDESLSKWKRSYEQVDDVLVIGWKFT